MIILIEKSIMRIKIFMVQTMYQYNTRYNTQYNTQYNDHAIIHFFKQLKNSIWIHFLSILIEISIFVFKLKNILPFATFINIV